MKEMDAYRKAMQERMDAIRESRKKEDCKEAPAEAPAPATDDTAAEETGT
jgi:hypothetical protein